jgi:AcrR family transcriptional regulator
MPKRLSEQEKEYIKKRLKSEAMNCMMSYGMKRTTVDELVKRVNIPKGTFYLFYESKELLFFEAINDLHDEIQQKLIQNMEKLSENPTVAQVTEVIIQLYKEVDHSGLLQVLTNGELELLMRKLPEEVVKGHLAKDDLNMDQFFSFIPGVDKKNLEVVSGALRGIFFTMLYQREIGVEIYEDALRFMLRGLIIQIMRED